ncbi:tex2 protein-related [Anaeramoeba ignava]|uniref:Tex2 protein-related n=1 Tax=Anaeramoeba ignava TaxID=1746090 RepID=A0A9Q0REW5_ANAIG|nr:tex2 protein-related [Anaeramoeba ignava]
MIYLIKLFLIGFNLFPLFLLLIFVIGFFWLKNRILFPNIKKTKTVKFLINFHKKYLKKNSKNIENCDWINLLVKRVCFEISTEKLQENLTNLINSQLSLKTSNFSFIKHIKIEDLNLGKIFPNIDSVEYTYKTQTIEDLQIELSYFSETINDHLCFSINLLLEFTLPFIGSFIIPLILRIDLCYFYGVFHLNIPKSKNERYSIYFQQNPIFGIKISSKILQIQDLFSKFHLWNLIEDSIVNQFCLALTKPIVIKEEEEPISKTINSFLEKMIKINEENLQKKKNEIKYSKNSKNTIDFDDFSPTKSPQKTPIDLNRFANFEKFNKNIFYSPQNTQNTFQTNPFKFKQNSNFSSFSAQKFPNKEKLLSSLIKKPVSPFRITNNLKK